jgi:uncharacterized protein
MKRPWQRLCQLGLILGFLWVNLWVAPAALATGAREIPLLDPSQPTWVIDQGDVLSPLSEGKLDRQLSRLAQETGNQLHLLSVRRLDYGETPATFANQLFERWFPTPESQVNQALLVLDVVTNGAAMRTGSGVTALLTDSIAESVAQESMRIPLRDNNYNEAFLTAAERLETVLSGRPDPGPPEVKVAATVESTFAAAEETNDFSAAIIVVVLLIVATVVPMATYFWYQRSS